MYIVLLYITSIIDYFSSDILGSLPDVPIMGVQELDLVGYVNKNTEIEWVTHPSHSCVR